MWPTTLPFVLDAATFAFIFRLWSDSASIMCCKCFDVVLMMCWLYDCCVLICFLPYDQGYVNDLEGIFKHGQQSYETEQIGFQLSRRWASALWKAVFVHPFYEPHTHTLIWNCRPTFVYITISVATSLPISFLVALVAHKVFASVANTLAAAKTFETTTEKVMAPNLFEVKILWAYGVHNFSHSN